MADDNVVLPVSALLTAVGLGGGALFNGGKLAGKLTAVAERVDKLESKQDRNVTREELDARFRELEGKIDLVIRMLEKHGNS